MFYLPIPYDLFLWLLVSFCLIFGLAYLSVSLLFTLICLSSSPSGRAALSPPRLEPFRPSEDVPKWRADMSNLRSLQAESALLGQESTQLVLGGLVTVASYQGSKASNQDYFLYEDFGFCKVVIVTDGVSSSQYPACAAQALSLSLYRSLWWLTHQQIPVVDRDFFCRACQEAVQRIARQVPMGATAETTFIVLLELPERFIVAHLGDGGLVRTRGNLRDGKSLLLAHHDEFGRHIGYVGAQGVAGMPTIIELSKSAFPDGEILLIGTDGALPPRQELGHAFQLLERLFQQGKRQPASFTDVQVAQEIEDYLKRCNPDDNATLGVLFTQEALEYWQQQWQTEKRNGQGEEDANLTRPLAAQERQRPSPGDRHPAAARSRQPGDNLSSAGY